MKKEVKYCGKKKNAHWSKQFIFWNSSPLVEEKFYLITCPLNTLAIFSPMLYNDPKVIKCQVGQHMQCGERFHFWPTSFSLVYTHPRPRLLSKESNGVGWKFVSLGTCVLSRVTNKGACSFIVLSCSSYKVSRKETLAQDLQYSCCYGAHIFLSTKKHLVYIQNMCFSHKASPQMVQGSQNCTCLYLW